MLLAGQRGGVWQARPATSCEVDGRISWADLSLVAVRTLQEGSKSGKLSVIALEAALVESLVSPAGPASWRGSLDYATV